MGRRFTASGDLFYLAWLRSQMGMCWVRCEAHVLWKPSCPSPARLTPRKSRSIRMHRVAGVPAVAQSYGRDLVATRDAAPLLRAQRDFCRRRCPPSAVSRASRGGSASSSRPCPRVPIHALAQARLVVRHLLVPPSALPSLQAHLAGAVRLVRPWPARHRSAARSSAAHHPLRCPSTRRHASRPLRRPRGPHGSDPVITSF